MTKKKALEMALAVVSAMATLTPQVKKELEEKLSDVFSSKGGRVADTESLVKRDAIGKITHIKDQHSGLFLPATAEVFYEDKSEKPRFVGRDGKGLKRLARVSESIYKKHAREVEDKKAEIQAKILDLDMNAPTFKQDMAKLRDEFAKLEGSKPDYSVIDVNTGKLKSAPAETHKA